MSARTALHLAGFDFTRLVSVYNEGRIPHVDFAVSGVCNLQCTYCALGAGTADPDELTLEELRDVLTQCAELGALTTSVTGKGEPLLDKKYLPLTEYINALRLAHVMFTNGTLITRDVAEILNGNGVSPVVKLNCLKPEVHNKLVGRDDGFDLAWQGLQHILAVYDQPHDESVTRIGVQTLVTQSTVRHIPELLEFCRKKRLYPVVDLIIPSGKIMELRSYGELQVRAEDNRWLYGEFKRIMGYAGYGVQGSDDGCPFAMGICIDNVGNVLCNDGGLSCLTTNRIVGNVRHERVAAIYKRLMETRQSAGFNCSFMSSRSDYFLPCPERIRVERLYYEQGCALTKASPYEELIQLVEKRVP